MGDGGGKGLGVMGIGGGWKGVGERELGGRDGNGWRVIFGRDGDGRWVVGGWAGWWVGLGGEVGLVVVGGG